MEYGPFAAAIMPELRSFAQVRAERKQPGANQLALAISDRRTYVHDVAANEGDYLGAYASALLALPEQAVKGVASVLPEGTPGRAQALGRSGYSFVTAPLNVIGAWRGLYDAVTGQ